MNAIEFCIQRALEANPLREPLLQSLIQSLKLPRGSRGFDAGCGIGLQARLLAEAVGPAGHITGVDLVPELLAYGYELERKTDLKQPVMFCAGDVSHIPFADHSFDWVWSADCVGYPAGDLAPILAELVRVVRPGGSVFLLGWSSQQLLPGYPLLEARLNATCSGFIPFLKAKNPEENFLRAIRSFNNAGLDDVKAQTFVSDIQAPLHMDERTALISLFEMLWGDPQPEVLPEDWKEYQRLCLPESPDFILDNSDYYAFFTYSLFRGKVPQ